MAEKVLVLLLCLKLTLICCSFAPRTLEQCDVIPIQGCSCRDPSKPFVSCQYLNISVVFPFTSAVSRVDTLDLSHNNIIFIDEYAFEPLDNLKRLSLANNGMRNENILLVLLHVKQHLEVLDLSNNRFLKVPGVIKRGMKSLTSLHLSHNDIYTIGNSFISTLPKLKMLFLDNNPIANIGENPWKNISPSVWMLRISVIRRVPLKKVIDDDLKAVQALSISGGRKARFKFIFDLLAPLYDLKYLELKDISLPTNIGPHVHDLVAQRIKFMSLKYNQMKNVPLRMLSRFPNLMKVDLSHNAIYEWQYEPSFKFSKFVNSIDLSDNLLRNVWPQAILSVKNLKFLSLKNNKLTDIGLTVKEIDSLGSKFIMELGGNPWQCSCRNAWLKELVNRHILRGESSHLKLYEVLHTLKCSGGTYVDQLISSVPQDLFECSKNLEKN